jgi:tetratricopeptide (TPR) repeat protein
MVQDAPDLDRPPTDLPVTPFALDPARIRFDLSYAYYNLAKLLRNGGPSTPAAKAFHQALEHLGRLVREQPGRGTVQHLLAKTHYDLGLLHQADGQIARAAAAWIRSGEMLEAMVREHPETWGYQYNLALNLRSLSLHADATGRPVEAEAIRRSAGAIEEWLIGEHSEARSYYYDAAVVYLNIPTAVVHDGTETGPVDRKTFAAACAGHAFSMLEAAEKAGYFRMWKRPAPASLGLTVVIDEVDQGCLQVVAKSAASGVGVAEAPSEDAQRQLLGQLGGCVWIADGAQQVAVDHRQIPLRQPGQCRVRRFGLAAVRLQNHCPLGGHLAQVLGQLIAIHPICSREEATMVGWGRAQNDSRTVRSHRQYKKLAGERVAPSPTRGAHPLAQREV